MIYRLFVIFSSLVILSISFALGVFFYAVRQPWVDFTQLEYYNPGKPSIVLDDQGQEWTRFYLDKREVISLINMPTCLIQAFLAAEDWDFFNHSGLSFKGIIRSIAVNIYNRRKAQGASTITQQLVRLLFFDAQKSFKRKIKEQLLALIVEQQFTKEHILETYLNHVYFGGGIYGVQAASQRFWAKTAQELSIDQAALLASIVQSPKRYCPLYSTQAAYNRRNAILLKMHKLGFITDQEYQHYSTIPIEIIKQDTSTKAPHLRESLRLFLEERVGKQKLYSGGLKIQTTLNTSMQENAQEVFNTYIEKFKTTISDDIEGALICIESTTGHIKTLIGGSNFAKSQFNRAFKARRQFGSTLKPLIYAAALNKGKSFIDTAIDEPLVLTYNNQKWTPQNFHHGFEGIITLARALSFSNNIVTIKTLLEIGAQESIRLAKEMGIKGPFHSYPSLALGCIDGTLTEATAILNTIAQGGIYVEPHYLLWIKDEWGTKIWRYKTNKKRILSWPIASQVAKVLTLTIERAKKRTPQLYPDTEALGKTGTTNDARTCWFTGSTPEFTTAVYIGCDDNRQLGHNVFASKTAMPIWRDFNKKIPHKLKSFSYDTTLKELTIHSKTGSIAQLHEPYTFTILIDKETAFRLHQTQYIKNIITD